MDEIIKGKNMNYALYEELLLRREQIQKEAYHYQREYMAEFGDLILEVFQKKIECIRKKKTIEFCQKAANYGQIVDQEKLKQYLEAEMADFQEQLEDMMKETESAKNRELLSPIEAMQIKKLYHKLVKIMHPDINPLVQESEELQILWHRITIAYECNQLEELQELEVQAMAALQKAGAGEIKIDIPNIEEKIAKVEEEIKRIKETEPYTYKYLLEDEEAVDQKKSDLRQELQEYEEYGKQLDAVMETVLGEGVRITWRMN